MTNQLILIVEDDANSRKLLRDVLQHKGYQTLEAETAEQGLRLVAERRPALILMDIHLPGISGIEALNRLRADETTRSIPVVAVTASLMSRQQTDVLEAGFDALERKPISVAGLLNTVQQLLDRRSTCPSSR
jgi:two-component system, cell cycle response regulator DivK